MAVRRILQLGDPKLWEKCAPVEDLSGDGAASLIGDLKDTLKSHFHASGFGRAIAAPQIGVMKRVVWIRMRPAGFCGALVNPEIVERDREEFELWDDCLSFPDLLVRVRRSTAVEVRYMNAEGDEQRLRATGDLAELLQHEIDHLDGILAIERAVSPQAFALRTEWERR